LGGLRICLISPGHLSTNPRLVKEATALTSAGHGVSIVCGCYTSWGRSTDAQLINSAWHVKQVAFGPVEAPRLVYLTQTARRRLARLLARYSFAAPFLIEPAHAPIVPGLIRAAAAIPADLYIAHYIAALPAAARAARLHGARYAFDAEDFHSGELPDLPEYKLDRQIVRSIEERYLGDAVYVTAASPMIAAAYAEAYGIETPTTLLNVFPRANAPLPPGPRGKEPGPSLYWFSQTIGPGRGLECAVEAIGRSESRAHLYLRGTPARGFDLALRKLAHSGGVGDRVHFLPPVPPTELERTGALFDLGYAGETGFSLNNSFALGNKLFSYLLSGLPTIASDIPAHRALKTKLDCAMAIFPANNPEALAASIDSHLCNPQVLERARAHAWRLGQQKYNWDVEQQQLLSLVSGVRC
jgi:glycosyltransferase involved in cell wall biosynthesis